MSLPTSPEEFTISWLLKQPAEVQRAILSGLTTLEQAALRYRWEFWARPDQLEPPGTWRTWLIMIGRGGGKTRSGSEWVRKVKAQHGRIALVGETAADVRDVMICGESGILARAPPWDRPVYNASRREITWRSGTIAKTYSGEEPDQLRGPQHEVAWVDEFAKFQYAQETWDNLQLGLRLGSRPRALVTTTPRPIPVLKELLRAAADGSTYVTRGSTYANVANLAPAFIAAIKARYEGTRLGRQELHAEVLDDLQGALWTTDMLEQARFKGDLPEMQRIVVGVDPSGFDGETGDSQGIVVCGKGKDGNYYVLDDRSVRMRPEGWGAQVVRAYRDYKADKIAVEKNFGGDMCRAVIQSVMTTAPVHAVSASRGKHVRAEPIAALYEQRKVKHVRPFPQLEEQMCLMTTQDYEGIGSPDRLDALVWAMTELTTGKQVQVIGWF
jgi:predicted phage terminase large subunit-like protein